MKKIKLADVEFRTTDGIFIKQMEMKLAGTIVPQHAHCWDHTSLLARGSVNVWKDGIFNKRYDAPTMILVPANVKHLFMSLVDDTIIYCIHNLHSEDKVAILSEHSLDEYDLASVVSGGA